ncbi:MFS transporter [Aquimonas voraii]|uniref:Glycoside/pentoside/hexuronide:cation symporter, GPH family n=1 Tax=Aquimonas voraii TaxID=265719 RepID=A0A1G6UNQ7_9GAMM|nr:MFS transporter [Aquimonas voraii]SDD42923.1 glycoside/pentoside/hexuronide:cation symporter, GPH family [Aquimonas voraii]
MAPSPAPAPIPSDRQARLHWRERLGYGAGDLGFNLYWTTIASFLAAFYTDVFGLGAAAAGTLLFVTRLFDAVTDPLMGAVADRTRTRWGQFRPWLLVGALPLAVMGVLTFSTPDFDEGGKLVWAYASFTLLMLAYTVLSTPYSALSGVMSSRSEERTTLNSLRFLFAFGGGALVNKFTLPLVDLLGDGDPQRGWPLTMALYGLIACGLFAFTFASTRQRIAPPPAQTSSPATDLRDLLRNRPWLILFGLAMLIMLTITLRAGSAYYYFTYWLQRPDLLPDYLLVQMLAYAAGAALAPLLIQLFDKSRLLAVLMLIVAALSTLFWCVGPEDIALVFALNILISLALGPKSPLTWSMYADSADFGEWRHGRRATAMTFAAATFSQKLGGSLGSAALLWVLAAIGYAANQAQSGASATGIQLLQTLVPGVFALLAAALAFAYPLSGTRLKQIQQELQERDAAAARP